MKLIYDIYDKPSFKETIVFAFQQVLAILAATITVPISVGHGMSTAAALFGAGAGTLIYLLFTKRRSPVFLGSSFAFIPSMNAAFAGAISASAGFTGIIIGALLAGLVYVIISLIVKTVGVDWIEKLMPQSVIGPTVSVIGLGLAGSAISSLTSGITGEKSYIALLCGLVTLFVTIYCSTYGNMRTRTIPFIYGILAGYAVAAVFTLAGNLTGNDALLLTDFSAFTSLFENGVSFSTFFSMPQFTFIEALQGVKDIDAAYLGTVAVAYMPVAFVVFAEHLADHKNISSIINHDLLTDPGLNRTLLGDGVGSMVGAFFGGCPNTTYGESIACVAISKNASIITIFTAAIECIILSFLSPVVAFITTIPSCVMGGVCMVLYGFIAVSGLKMVQKVDLESNRNLFVVSTILIAGIGGLTLSFGKITVTNVACALILGICVNFFLSKEAKK